MFSEPVRNKSGYYEVRWSEPDAKAKRSRSRSLSCGTKNKREAVAFREHFIKSQGVIAAATTSWTVQEILDAYERRHLRAGSVNALYVIRRELGPLDVGDLTEDVIDAFRDKRLLSVTSGTVRRELNALKAGLNWAASRRRSPAILYGVDLPTIDLPADNPPRTNYLSETEEERMFALAVARASNNDIFPRRRIGLFLTIALETAARAGAIRGLTWDRVDFTSGLIDFRDPSKVITKKKRVPVPISARLRPVLEEAYRRRDVNNNFVLEHAGSVRNPFVKFCDDHGFDCTIHDLRRTWATLRVKWGAPIEKVAAVLGDTIEVTTKHYAQFGPGYAADVMDLRGAAVA